MKSERYIFYIEKGKIKKKLLIGFQKFYKINSIIIYCVIYNVKRGLKVTQLKIHNTELNFRKLKICKRLSIGQSMIEFPTIRNKPKN